MGNTNAAWWFKRGEEYLQLAIKENSERSTSRLLHLQHAAEFFFKALILHHSGHHPHIRNPYTLMHICRLYVPEVQNIFPRNSLKEILLFSYLNPYRFIGQERGEVKEEVICLLQERVEELKALAAGWL